MNMVIGLGTGKSRKILDNVLIPCILYQYINIENL